MDVYALPLNLFPLLIYHLFKLVPMIIILQKIENSLKIKLEVLFARR